MSRNSKIELHYLAFLRFKIISDSACMYIEFWEKRYGPLTREALFKLGHKLGHFEREKSHLKILLVKSMFFEEI